MRIPFGLASIFAPRNRKWGACHPRYFAAYLARRLGQIGAWHPLFLRLRSPMRLPVRSWAFTLSRLGFRRAVPPARLKRLAISAATTDRSSKRWRTAACWRAQWTIITSCMPAEFSRSQIGELGATIRTIIGVTALTPSVGLTADRGRFIARWSGSPPMNITTGIEAVPTSKCDRRKGRKVRTCRRNLADASRFADR